MEAKKILFITQEIDPYVPATAATPLGHEVPLTLLESGREVRAFMPKWGNINERRNQLHEVIRLSGLNLTIGGTDHSLLIKVASVVGTRMQVYFIDNDDFFAKRLQERDAEGKEYADNVNRAVFYARSVLETMKKLRWTPEVIHCSGWISCMVPMMVKTAYADEPIFKNSRVVFTPTPNGLTKTTKEASRIIEYKTATARCLREIGKDLTPAGMDKLGVKYADGVSFISEPNADLVAYAQKLGKSIKEGLEIDATHYAEFYDQVWSKGKKVED